MSIRQLPKLPAISARAGLNFDIAPTALARFQPEIRAAAKDEDENVISILGSIGENFFGEGITARRISAALRAIGDKDVTVHINSPGGDYFEGLAIYNLLREHKREVTVKVLGLAASAASIIAMAGDRVEVPRAGFLMIHNTWVMAMGDRHDLREFAATLEPFDDAMASVYVARSGMDEKEVHKMMDRETWMAGEQAVDKGFADALLAADEAVADAQASAALGAEAALKRIDAMLAKAGLPRSERRRLIAELTSGKPGAADDDPTPRAGDSPLADSMKLLGEINLSL